MTDKIVLRQDSALSIENAVERYNMLIEFTRRVMKEDTDFGKIPGAGTKPTLLKPGAEKLNNLFSHYPTFTLLDKILDFDTGRFYFQYQCDLFRVEDGRKVGSGNGSCNSLEVKYRYRLAERKCPECGKSTIVKGRQEYGGGWVCFAKKGGCGAKFMDGDAEIEAQQVGRIENTEPFDLVNTLDKMAQKRAFIAATLIACNASEFFTQDIEDMQGVIPGEYREVTESPSLPEADRGVSHVPFVTVKAKTEKKTTPPSVPETFSALSAKMALKTAMGILNHDGIAYGELETETLSHMANTLTDKLKQGAYKSDEKRTEAAFKRDACETILASRANSPASSDGINATSE